MKRGNIKTCAISLTGIILSVLSAFLLISILGRNYSLWIWSGAIAVSFLLIFFVRKSAGDEKAFDRVYPFCVLVGLAVMGFFQMRMIEHLRFSPVFDLEAIYGGAIEWVETGSFPDHYDYFDWFPNNLGGLCFLFLIFKVSSVFSSDYFLAAACMNEALILLTILFTSLSAKKMWGSKFGLLAFFMSAGILPYWFMADAFYTDSLSLLFPILLFYFFLQMEDEKDEKKNKYWIYLFLSAVTASLGAFIKPTVMIMGVAVFLSLLLRGKWKRAGIYAGVLGIVYAVFFSTVYFYMYQTHLDPVLADIKNTPSYHWVMMGLKGEGAYDPGDYEFTRSFTSPADRDDALKAEILDRIREKGAGGMISLYAAKLFRCFGDGTLGLSDFLDDNPQRETVLHRYLLYEGSDYGKYRNLCNMIFYGYLMLATVYIIRNRKETEDENNCCYLKLGLPLSFAFGGIVFFLMHWETSPRYITNYVPVILLLAVGGVRQEGVRISFMNRSISKEGKIFLTALAFRGVVYLFSVCVMAIMGDYPQGIHFSDFLEAWKRWDSAHYINIAENGYAGAVENGEHLFLVFYPLYPWMMRTLALFFRDFRLCGILISMVCYGVGSVFFYRITEEEFGSYAAKNAVILIGIFPFAFFFGSIVTESLFFAFSATFLYYLRKHNWLKVAFCGFFACMTRVQGLLLCFAVLVEIFHAYNGIGLLKDRNWKDFVQKIIRPGCICATMLLGFAIYLLVNQSVEGDPFRFRYYLKDHWNQSLGPVWDTFRYVKDYAVDGWDTSVGMCLWVPELLLFFGYLAMIGLGIYRKFRPMYLAYLVVYFLLTYSATWLLSAGRYTLNALPVFMLSGDLLSHHEKWKTPVIVLSAMLMALYMIAYYSWKQVM